LETSIAETQFDRCGEGEEGNARGIKTLDKRHKGRVGYVIQRFNVAQGSSSWAIRNGEIRIT